MELLLLPPFRNEGRDTNTHVETRPYLPTRRTKLFSTSAANEALVGQLGKMPHVELTRQPLPFQEAQTEEASPEQPRTLGKKRRAS